MPTGHILQNEPIDQDLAMILVGEKKAGKSELASTAPAPVLFLDFDQRAGALKNKKDVYALTYADPGDINMLPTAFNELLTTMSLLEKSRKLKFLDKSFASLPDNLEVKTIVFDSIQTIANSARKYVMYGNDAISVKFQIASKTYRVPKSFHAWGGEQAMVEGCIMQALAIPGLNVICTLHECMEEAENSTDDNPIYTGKIEVYPRRYNSLLVYFNEVWRVVRDYGRLPKVQIDPDGKFTMASTALGVDSVKELSISAVLNEAKAKLALPAGVTR